MQKVFIAGNVSSVKELRDVGQNKVFNFSVAVSNGKEQSGDWKPSSFYEVGMWGKRGEALAKFVTKGMKVAVSGRLQPPRVHDGKAYMSIDADDVTPQGGGEQAGGIGHQEQRRDNSPPQDDGSEIPF